MITRTVTTLNIEASSVRYLTVAGKRVHRWGSMPLRPSLVRDTVIADLSGVASAVAHLLTSAGAPTRNVVVALTGLRSVSRLVALPRLRAGRTKEAIRWAGLREMPMPMEDLQLSWQVIDNDGVEQRIFLLGTPLDLLDTTSHALWKAGIRPRVIDLKPLALARMVNRAEAIIIDLESDSTSIIILRHGIPEVMHTMVLTQEGMLLSDRVQKLAGDLARTVGFYNNAHPESRLEPTTPAFLTGEMAGNPTVLELVQDTVEHPTGLPVPPIELPAGFPVSRYAVNLGLALGHASPHRKIGATVNGSCPIILNILPARSWHHLWQGIGISPWPSAPSFLARRNSRRSIASVRPSAEGVPRNEITGIEGRSPMARR